MHANYWLVDNKIEGVSYKREISKTMEVHACMAGRQVAFVSCYCMQAVHYACPPMQYAGQPAKTNHLIIAITQLENHWIFFRRFFREKMCYQNFS